MNNNGNSVQDILSNDETILWQGRPNKKAYLWSLITFFLVELLIVGFIGAILWVFLYITSYALAACIVVGIIGACFVVGMIFSIIKSVIPSIIEIKNIEYVVTDKRLLYKSGVIGMDYNSVSYKDIGNVNIKVGLLDKMFGVGSIECRSVAGSNINITCIDNCYDLYKKLYKIVLDIQTDIKYPNALRPEENPGYKTKYKNEE